ncbi:bifunctional demethylmenaquinone methyltransferase/2-methoxy-6-polyprenyl-1,4-benzoquinol methylase UbiE [Candidatus Liberibacter asiaticus]|uniref:Ubiquinone/menaquinone biosynthesis C-methyltransferase UbiE n=2 Tax=Liberibacter asiaticus TaxID=34021 RepID=C6XFE4_LIBAP|nr:bifunctional demethylmenaquinone methyltransferase/2-methoxy-6-polyprenyl-1,4-benzoquinol methylase UbiE [Candidatus Liberibacter asiaticus]ACT57097.1 ubiquinone/menaquinone biosynthesis methyltransferase [Candidatus Liberibacter asiaticus str. psy62]AGH16938.1 ubiquinone/menaquinone biosynthesis methyltransferase [Candidatus Liberibacter asiaticus str. gxpsy]ALK07277.1 bifunctional demethylmenaquinone methyltransferase/2-methoxy-6-polyprenyl-1,4-benzoquinol methylase UbiE [Candidatus Liberib
MTKDRFDSDNNMKTSYGFREVPEEEKQNMVNHVFSRVSHRYDVMNDLMSLGLHRFWKEAMVTNLNPRKSKDYRVLDVAGGTGDVAFRIAEASDNRSQIVVADINNEMLSVGRDRAFKENLQDCITFIEANAETLPFEANSFDACTLAFGIRNMPHITLVLQEIYRILKCGGRLLVLEFSEVQGPVFKKIYDMWSFKVIPQLGRFIAGDEEPYQYLIESIRRFPNQQDFAAVISAAGFSNVSFTNYTNGVVALHSGWKCENIGSVV